MPPGQWTFPDFEEKLGEPIAIELVNALALATNVQENGLGFGSHFGMHGAEIGDADYANYVTLPYAATMCIDRFEVKLGHLRPNEPR